MVLYASKALGLAVIELPDHSLTTNSSLCFSSIPLSAFSITSLVIILILYYLIL